MAQAQWAEAQHAKFSDGVLKGQRNEFAVTTTSGLGLSVNAGNAVLDGLDFYADAATALTLTAADPANPRIDLIVLRSDEAGHTGTITFKTGTPAPSPVAPTVTQTRAGTYELALAQARVNAGATTIASLTDVRTFAQAAIAPNGVVSSMIASVLATAVQAGALPAGVTLPATQLTAGAAPAGVTIPAGQVTQGNLNIGTGTFTSDNGTIHSNGAGVLSVAQIRPTGGNSGINQWGIFAGTGSGNFSHGLTISPQWVGITPHVAGSATIGYDSENATTTNITLGASLAWRATAWG